MTIQGDFTNKPNSGCLTPEINRQMADNTARIIKKADEAVDKFIKSDEGIEKKNSLKKKIGAGILAFAGIGAAATWAIKSGKLNKIKNLFTKKASNVGEMAKKGADEATEAVHKKANEVVNSSKMKFDSIADGIKKETDNASNIKKIVSEDGKITVVSFDKVDKYGHDVKVRQTYDAKDYLPDCGKKDLVSTEKLTKVDNTTIYEFNAIEAEGAEKTLRQSTLTKIADNDSYDCEVYDRFKNQGTVYTKWKNDEIVERSYHDLAENVDYDIQKTLETRASKPSNFENLDFLHL